MTQYLLNDPTRPVGLIDVLDPAYPAASEILRVGANQQFKTLAAAVAASKNGDVILVDAGTYTNDFARVATKLTIIGVGGMVNLVATVPCPDGKAIMTVDNDLTLENFTFTGAKVPDGNGAGIRYEAGNLTLVNDGFYNNQDGLLAANSTGSIAIDHSVFSGNGAGDGYTHNLYVGQVAQLTVTNSILQNAVVGHELKSRALANTISNNLFSDGPTGTASYEIDLPNGGADTVTDNVIEKGPHAQNNAMLHFGGEGVPYLNSSLLVQGNTFINDKGGNITGVLNATGTVPVSITANTFQNITASQIASGPATIVNNKDASGAALGPSGVTTPPSAAPSTPASDGPQSVTLTSSLRSVQGGAGHLTVYASAGQVVASGGSGGMDYSESPSSSANQISTAAGSTNKLTITGNDQVVSRGNDTISTGALSVAGTISGAATIQDGSAFDSWTVAGALAINGHGGAPLLTLTAGAQATVTGAYSSLRIGASGANVSVDMTQSGGALNGAHFSFSIQGGASTTSVYGGAIGIATASGPQGATIRLGDGAVQVTSNGHDTIWAGAGADSVILVGGGAAEVHAGTGSLSVYGRSIPAGSEGKVYGNGGAVTLDGDTGNIIYYGGATANTVNAKLGRVTLIGGAGRMTVSGGYAQTITGGSGGLTYSAGGAASGTITTASGVSNALNLGASAPFTVNSWGTDSITGGNGGTFTVHGNAVISGGGGNRTMTLMGADVVNGGGQDIVSVTAGANVTFNAGTSATVSETAATLNLSVGGAYAGSAAISGGAATAYATTANGLSIATKAASGTQLTLASGDAKVTTGGADQIHAGSGNATITLLSDNVQIWGGSGSITVAPQYFGHTGLHFIAGSGTANLNLWSAGGNDIVFGKGNTAVSAGGGPANAFEFFAGQGGAADVITGFRAGTDHLLLHGVTIASEGTSGGSANLVLSDNTHVQLVGVTNLAHLLA